MSIDTGIPMTYAIVPTSSGTQTVQGTDPDGNIYSIPDDPRNRDYQDYLTYIEANPWTPAQLTAQQDALAALQVQVAAGQAVTTTNQTTIGYLVAGLSAQVTQAQADLTTLASSTDALAPILARCIEGVLGVAEGLASIGVLGGHIDANKVPKI